MGHENQPREKGNRNRRESLVIEWPQNGKITILLVISLAAGSEAPAVCGSVTALLLQGPDRPGMPASSSRAPSGGPPGQPSSGWWAQRVGGGGLRPRFTVKTTCGGLVAVLAVGP